MIGRVERIRTMFSGWILMPLESDSIWREIGKSVMLYVYFTTIRYYARWSDILIVTLITVIEEDRPLGRRILTSSTSLWGI